MRGQGIPIRGGATAVVAALVIGFTPVAESPADQIGSPHPTTVYQPTRFYQPTTLTAQTTALVTPGEISSALAFWVQRIVVPPSVGAPFPEPEFPPVVAPTSIGSSVKNIYNTVEPWVEYGFDVAAYVVGWIPWVGWLAPQISIFYDFGERIVRSITFNIADWIDRQVSFGEGLVNVGQDTVDAFIQLGIDQWNFWLPPLPPLPGTAEAPEDASEPEAAAISTAPNPTRTRPVRQQPAVTAEPDDPTPRLSESAIESPDETPEQKRLDRKLERKQQRAAEVPADKTADKTADNKPNSGVTAGAADDSDESAEDPAPTRKKVRTTVRDRESATAGGTAGS